MYSRRPGLTLAFHGCDLKVARKVICDQVSLRKSKNVYDWLGHGIYFWENSPERALEFAYQLKNNPPPQTTPVKEPAVIGAVLNLGYTLDLLDYGSLQILKEGFNLLRQSLKAKDIPVAIGTAIAFLILGKPQFLRILLAK